MSHHSGNPQVIKRLKAHAAVENDPDVRAKRGEHRILFKHWPVRSGCIARGTLRLRLSSR